MAKVKVIKSEAPHEPASADLVDRKKSEALVIDLKAGEKILIGTSVITNESRQRTRLHIAGDSQILRQKDVMKEADATSPCKRLYFLIQCMYLSDKPYEYHIKFFQQVREIQNAAPSCSLFIMQIGDQILAGHYYKALKKAQELIEHERELLEIALKQAAE